MKIKKETDFYGSGFSFIRTVKGRNVRGSGNCVLPFRGLGFYRSGKGTFGVEDSTCRAVPLHLEVINTSGSWYVDYLLSECQFPSL